MEEGDTEPTESENESDSSDESLSDLEQRLKPITTSRMKNNSIIKETNGIGGSGDTKLILSKGENSPR